MVDFAKEFDSDLVFPCDVGIDEEIDALFVELRKHWDGLMGSFTPSPCPSRMPWAGISGRHVAGKLPHCPRLSAYSFSALAKARSYAEGRNPAILTLTYLGANRSVPHYNLMGMAKASLESSVYYLAANLGPKNIRVNAISAGPIKTLAASGIADFNKLLAYGEKNAPLRRNVTIDEVGNAAAFLMSDLASGITGEITYVDGGFNTTAGLAVES